MDEDWLKNSTLPLRTWRQQVGVGAELVGGKQLDLEPAAGRLADAVDRLLRADVDRMRRVLPGRQLVIELGRGSGPGEDAAERHGGAGRQQGPAGDLAFCASWSCFALTFRARRPGDCQLDRASSRPVSGRRDGPRSRWQGASGCRRPGTGPRLRDAHLAVGRQGRHPQVTPQCDSHV